MALNIGQAILSMMGNKDPQQLLAQLALGGGQPGSGGPTPAGAAPLPGTVTPAQGTQPPAPPRPTAYDSPPDLLQMYSTMVDSSAKSQRIDTGLGLLTSAFAQPENRGLIMQAVGGGQGSGNIGEDYLKTIMGIQQSQQEAEAAAQAEADKKAAEAAQLSQLPAIAEKYGLTQEEVSQMYYGGVLDEFISKQNEMQRTTQADGNGQIVTVDQVTGAMVGSPVGAAKPETLTDDQKELAQENAARATQGMPALTMAEWLAMVRKPQTTSVTVNNSSAGASDIIKEFAPTWKADFDSARSALNSLQSVGNARASLDAAGGVITGNALSPATLEGRKIISSMFGIDDAATTNTESFKAALSDIIRAEIKDLGAGNSITDADRKFMEQAVGASGTLNEDSIRRILRIIESGRRRKIVEYNSSVDEFLAANADENGQVPKGLSVAMRKVPVPPLSEGYKTEVSAGVPQGAIDLLMQNAADPSIVQQFNQKFGPGRAEQILEAFGG